MPHNDMFRDYLYVSARKVIRMSRTLRPAAWKSVRGLQLRLGPVGATLKLSSDSLAEDVVSLVPEVERAIDEHSGIKYLTDPGLRVGHWFMVDGAPMTYGVPGVDIGGVLFIGEAGTQFVLGGSVNTSWTGRLRSERVASGDTAPPTLAASAISFICSRKMIVITGLTFPRGLIQVLWKEGRHKYSEAWTAPHRNYIISTRLGRYSAQAGNLSPRLPGAWT